YPQQPQCQPQRQYQPAPQQQYQPAPQQSQVLQAPPVEPLPRNAVAEPPGPADVRIEIEISNGVGGNGSGTAIGQGNGTTYVLTCAHNVSGARAVYVVKGTDKYQASVVAVDQANDVAIVVIRAPLRYVRVAES